MELLIPSVGIVFWSFIVFLILFLVLRKYAWRPVLKAVKDRENDIDQSLKNAEKAQKEFEELRIKCERILKEAYAQKEGVLKEANSLKERIVSEAKNQAKQEGEKAIKKTKEEILNTQKKMESQMREQMYCIALEIARKVLVKEFSQPKIQEEYIEEEIAKVKLN